MANEYTDHNEPEYIQDAATNGAGEGAPASSLSDIETFMDNEVSLYGTLHQDETTLPATAQERFHDFYSPQELEDWLALGLLVHHDGSLGVTPNPIVHIVKFKNDLDDDFLYRVFIDGETT